MSSGNLSFLCCQLTRSSEQFLCEDQNVCVCFCICAVREYLCQVQLLQIIVSWQPKGWMAHIKTISIALNIRLQHFCPNRVSWSTSKQVSCTEADTSDSTDHLFISWHVLIFHFHELRSNQHMYSMEKCSWYKVNLFYRFYMKTSVQLCSNGKNTLLVLSSQKFK